MYYECTLQCAKIYDKKKIIKQHNITTYWCLIEMLMYSLSLGNGKLSSVS